MSLAITRSNALLWHDPDLPGVTRLVPRYHVNVTWTHAGSVQNLDKFEISIFTTGGDPLTNKVIPTTFVSGSARTAEIALAPLQDLNVSAAVRTHYLNGTISAWRTIGSGTAIDTVTAPVVLADGQPHDIKLEFVNILNHPPMGGVKSPQDYTTAAMAAGGYNTGAIVVPRIYSILSIATSAPVRVRIYLTAAQRDADIARAATVDPEGDHGCILEVVTTSGALSYALTPVPIGSSPTGEELAYITVNNNGATEGLVAVVSLVVLSAGDVLTGNATDWADILGIPIASGLTNGILTAADYTTFLNKINDTEKGAAYGVATLGADSKIPVAQIPAISIGSIYVVASQVAQLALTAQEGDVAVRSDLSKSYVHNGGVAGTMADWQELLTPIDTVLSVAGKTGTVTLATADVVGLDTALSGKAPTSHAHAQSDVTGMAASLALLAPLAAPAFTGRLSAPSIVGTLAPVFFA